MSLTFGSCPAILQKRFDLDSFQGIDIVDPKKKSRIQSTNAIHQITASECLLLRSVYLNRLASGVKWICVEDKLKLIKKLVRYLRHILFVFSWQ